MILREPKVEFVALNLSETIATLTSYGGGQRCFGSQPDANNCPGWVNQIEWDPPTEEPEE